MEWKQSVEYLSSAVETPQSNWRNLDYPVVLNALTGWLNSSITEDGAMNPSPPEVVSRRVVFLFNNDYTLTLGKGITPTIARLSEQITGDQPLPFEGMLKQNWEYSRAVNGWRRNEDLSNKDLENFLIALSEELGESPILILPFESKLLRYFPESQYEPRKSGKDYPTWIEFLNLFTEENRKKTVETLGLSLIVCDDEEYISEHCDWSRLIDLIVKLEESDDLSQVKTDWVESFDDWNHLPDGTFTAVVYDLDPDEQRSFKKLASECGLDAGPWEDGKFVAEGDIWLAP